MATNVTITPVQTHDGMYHGKWCVTNDEDSNDFVVRCSNVGALEFFNDNRRKIGMVRYYDRARGVDRTFKFSARYVEANWF